MLFDLRGRRRRAVQATYLTLAVLMGGGLVLFGIGGDVQGGLFDAFTGGDGGGSGNELVEKRIERNEKRAAAGSEAALKELVRDYYQLANSEAGSGAQTFPDEAKGELRKAGAAWERYLDRSENPDPSLAGVAVQIYDFRALHRPKEAQRAAALVAEASNDPQAYLQLVQYAVAAGDKRTANLAATKAVDLAPKDQRKEIERLAEQIKKAPPPTTTQQQAP
jgi:hypothetical protein